MKNDLEKRVISDFGLEWTAYNQEQVPNDELHDLFERYFSIFPLDLLTKESAGFDLGCGSGRWARLIAPRVGTLHCIDPSPLALETAKNKLSGMRNCYFYLATVDAIPLEDDSMDFGYTLGVLHHTTDTEAGIKHCIKKLKPGAPFLLYLYYAFDNRPLWYGLLWKVSNLFRQIISVLPFPVKKLICFIIALFIYFPLARLALLSEKLGINVDNFTLSDYRNRSLYTMLTDSLDRFGTRLEKRFTRQQISEMLLKAGTEKIQFSDHSPYWCAIAYKKMDN